MRKVVFALAGLCLLAACGPKHFITDKQFRDTVEEDFRNRTIQVGMSVFADLQEDPAVDQKPILEEEEALKFLYAYMPLADITDYTPAFYLENVKAAFATRSLWNVPEREFRHFVLPLRVNNENLDSARVVFARELLPRITGLSMQDAILEVNHWCHEKMTYPGPEYAGRHPGGEPLVPRKGDLSAFRRPHVFAAEPGEKRPGPLWGTVYLLRNGAALRGHSRPSGVYAPLGPYRRQPRLGGSLGRWAMVVPGCL